MRPEDNTAPSKNSKTPAHERWGTLYARGSLRSFIAERRRATPEPPFGLGWVWFGNVLLRMLRAVNHLISHDLVHGDIKDDQWFLDDAGQIFLGDFGTAWKLTDEDGVQLRLQSRDELVDRRAGVSKQRLDIQ